MSQEITVRKHGEIRTFVTLRYSSWCILDRAKEKREGWYYECMASIVFSAFAFEAYLNHAGQKVCDFWESVDRISYRDKLKVLSKLLSLDIDYGRAPFQRVIELFAIRNILAHGRTEFIDKTFTVKAYPDTQSLTETLADWEDFISLESAERVYEDITAAIEFLNTSPLLSEDPLWFHGLRGFEVTSVNTG